MHSPAQKAPPQHWVPPVVPQLPQPPPEELLLFVPQSPQNRPCPPAKSGSHSLQHLPWQSSSLLQVRRQYGPSAG
jgi:hypothetical protein